MKYLKVQMQLMLKRSSFIITFSAMILFVNTYFVINCINFYNDDISMVLSAKYLFLGSDLAGIITEFIKIFFPLIAVLPFSDSYYEERENRTIEFCFSRLTNNQYYFSKLITCFISGFIIISIPLLLNVFLNFIAFPMDSTKDATNFSYIHSHLFNNVMETGMFQKLFAENMYLYNLVYLLLLSIASGLISVITYQISFFMKIKRITLLFVVFAVYNLLTLFFSVVGLQELCLNNYVFAAMFYSGQSVEGMIITFSLLILAAIVPMFFAKRKLVNYNV